MNSTLGDGEQPYDLRHENTTAVDDPREERHALIEGGHVDNDQQESFFRPTYNDAGEQIGVEINHPHAQRPEFPGMPSRVPSQSLFSPPPPMPAFGTGLSWQAAVTSPRIEDLASQDWATMERMPNVELHTLFAHLMVTAESIRSEMRKRGMRVDL